MWQKEKKNWQGLPSPASSDRTVPGYWGTGSSEKKLAWQEVERQNYIRMFRGVEYCFSFKRGLSWWIEMLSRSFKLEFWDDIIILNELSKIWWPVSRKWVKILLLGFVTGNPVRGDMPMCSATRVYIWRPVSPTSRHVPDKYIWTRRYWAHE